MKFAIYTLAGAMIVATVAGLALSGSQPVAAPSIKPGSHEVVYVDLDKIVQMHPAWQALSMSRSVVNDVRDGSIQIESSASKVKPADYKTHVPATDPDIRQRLVSETIRVADDAMMKLERQQLEAVDLHLRQRRETMHKSDEAEVMTGAREINDKAANDVEQIVREHCSDKINAELKVTALKLKSGKPGIDDKLNASKLEAAENDLARINEQCSSETGKILDLAKAQTESLWANAATRTDASLSIIESEEKRTITNRAAASRNDILRELLSLYDSDNQVAALRPASGRITDVDVLRPAQSDSGRIDIGNWRSGNAVLEKRIRQDVMIAVSRIAKAVGVRVVFSRTSAGVPDQTKRFVRLMSERAWDGCDPVISMAGES